MGAFGFAGEQRDPESRQVHLRARQYAPGLGRFLSRDAVIPNAPGTQGYHPDIDAAGNPAMSADPGENVRDAARLSASSIRWCITALPLLVAFLPRRSLGRAYQAHRRSHSRLSDCTGSNGRSEERIGTK